ncbi:MAG: hypothetical protein PHT53_07150, partial [Candidatus Omnitrophica bacterium]|nr:hypothetical protein [Candidatus Omnitrophota bacterium]
FVLLLAKDLIIKTSVEKGVEIVTGLKLDIGSLNVGIFKPVTDIKNLRLFNPAGFPDKTMIDMPEIYVRYDLPAIIGGNIHLPEVRLGLREFVVVKNSKGELNLDALKNVQAQKKGESKAAEKPAGKAPKIKIDKLALNIGKVIYKDYSKGSTPSVKEFNINLNEVYTNIDDPYKLASLIVVKALIGTPIAALTNFDLKGLTGSVGDITAGAQKMATEAASKAGETATQAVDKMKGLLTNPFGSEK